MKYLILATFLFVSSQLYCQVLFGIDLDDKEQFLQWDKKVYFEETYYYKLFLNEFDKVTYSPNNNGLVFEKVATNGDFYYNCYGYLVSKLGKPDKKDNKYNSAASDFNWTIDSEVLFGYRSYSNIWILNLKYLGLTWSGSNVSFTVVYK